MSAKERIFQEFHSGALSGKTLGEICKILHIPYREKSRLIPLLNELVEEGKLFVDDMGRYGTIEDLGLLSGIVTGNERGFAFLTVEGESEDFFIPKKALHGALHGDKVLAYRTGEKEGDEVFVLKVVERGYKTIVGTFRKDRKAGYLYPDEKRFCQEIYIPLSECHQIKNGVKAVAEITSYPKGKSPGGKIIEVLGEEDDFFAEELSIIRSYNLREEFPPHVEKDAEKAKRKGITEKDISSRKDFRKLLTVTIDGEDTRDIDDAVSLYKDGENYILGVHIADVSHYVERLSPLDKEAYERGTSVYFPDCVLPMLPKALSNGICSLNEGEDRLTLSCIMHVDKKGVVYESEIVESIIRSNHKMTYTEATEILEGNSSTCEKYADVKDTVLLFEELTKILQAKREKQGSVTLDVKESKILFDKESYEITIPDYKRPFSYEIIEAFMVLANETVAEYMHSIDAPFIYRVHEKPTEEKASAFRAFAQGVGVNARFNATDVKPYDYQNVLISAKDIPSFAVLNRVMLRSMQKARYSAQNNGHFGLASKCYCHFTSPIRRYPDLCIHRIIKKVLNGGYEEAQKLYGDLVESIAKQCSEREKRATEAERDVDDLYKTMYMSERIGEEYEAVVSGVTSFGIFAELKNSVEGFIPIESLFGYFKFDKDTFTLRSADETFTLGEKLLVEVVDVDFYRRRTQFRLLEKVENEPTVYKAK